ncbi:FHA domain-containing protein FhaB [Caloramator mitchellensis]|uniref:FHA domain-containing protein FhaB n=1 Tax=Caloramator mitchellensis TaxID=908809 RepID=A0A0R3JU77_CALMK|nr:FHA domain-containing protein [Caloramator mitchellensis]KRQ87111.1 FHA domain-containing protein FhaB [Caloramator mitchellensis]
MKEIAMILKFVVIGLIYLVLFRIIRVMYLDLKGVKPKGNVKEYTLEVIDAPEETGLSRGSFFLVHKVLLIGRNDDSDITIKDPYISGNHAKIFVKNNNLYIEDLNSTNGTFLNGKRIKDLEGIDDGDIIEMGRVTFKVVV